METKNTELIEKWSELEKFLNKFTFSMPLKKYIWKLTDNDSFTLDIIPLSPSSIEILITPLGEAKKDILPLMPGLPISIYHDNTLVSEGELKPILGGIIFNNLPQGKYSIKLGKTYDIEELLKNKEKGKGSSGILYKC